MKYLQKILFKIYYPNESSEELKKFLLSIDSMGSKFSLKLVNYHKIISENTKLIVKKISKINNCIETYEDNLQLYIFRKDLKLLLRAFKLLNEIDLQFSTIKSIFTHCDLFLKQGHEYNSYNHGLLRHYYEKTKITIADSKKSILLNINFVKSFILQMPKLSENMNYLNIFKNIHESCLVCFNNKKEDLVCGFDNCHHKICKYCEEMFYLKNIICSNENEMTESRLITNRHDVDKILINGYHRIIVKTLKSIYKVIDLAKCNYLENLNKDHLRFSRLDATTFTSLFDNNFVRRQKIEQILNIYSSYHDSNVDKFYEMNEKLYKLWSFAKISDEFLDNVMSCIKILTDFEGDAMKTSKDDSTELNRQCCFLENTSKRYFNQWNSFLKEIIENFDEIDMEDEHGSIGNMLQILRETFSFLFN